MKDIRHINPKFHLAPGSVISVILLDIKLCVNRTKIFVWVEKNTTHSTFNKVIDESGKDWGFIIRAERTITSRNEI